MKLSELSEIVGLNEALIILGKKRYPNFDTVVIMAGGSGSGKGFVIDKLLGVEGRVFNTDDLKEFVMKSDFMNEKILKKHGIDTRKYNLTDPKDVSKLHVLVAQKLGLDVKLKDIIFYSSMMKKERKPNLIFDVTLGGLNKLEQLSRQLMAAGYDRKNIHIVWVANDIEVALKNNKNPDRGRVVDDDIVISIHDAVSRTMSQMLDMGKRLSKFIDGDIVIAFNKQDVDSTFKTGKSKKAGFIVKAFYFKVKEQGKAPTPVAKLDKEVKAKIKSYVPKHSGWE